MRSFRRQLSGMLCLAVLTSACARGEITGSECKHGLGLDNGGALDYGVTNYVTVVNRGEPGQITVFAKVSTNQGEYERQRPLQFSAGEQKEVEFLFTEPTITADDIRCESSAFP